MKTGVPDKKSERGGETLKKILERDESVGITVINLHDIMYGLHKYAKIVTEVLRLSILNYTKNDAVLAASI